jgi:hypothetical protein
MDGERSVLDNHMKIKKAKCKSTEEKAKREKLPQIDLNTKS